MRTALSVALGVLAAGLAGQGSAAAAPLRYGLYYNVDSVRARFSLAYTSLWQPGNCDGVEPCVLHGTAEYRFGLERKQYYRVHHGDAQLRGLHRQLFIGQVRFTPHGTWTAHEQVGYRHPCDQSGVPDDTDTESLTFYGRGRRTRVIPSLGNALPGPLFTCAQRLTSAIHGTQLPDLIVSTRRLRRHGRIRLHIHGSTPPLHWVGDPEVYDGRLKVDMWVKLHRVRGCPHPDIGQLSCGTAAANIPIPPSYLFP